jgi:hypothetical protein
MTPETTGEARAALAAFPGIVDVKVIVLDTDQADQCLSAYVMPSGPGLNMPEPHAHARKTLRMRAVRRGTWGGQVRPRQRLLRPGRPLDRGEPTAGDTDRQLDQMADARK